MQKKTYFKTYLDDDEYINDHNFDVPGNPYMQLSEVSGPISSSRSFWYVLKYIPTYNCTFADAKQ